MSAPSYDSYASQFVEGPSCKECGRDVDPDVDICGFCDNWWVIDENGQRTAVGSRKEYAKAHIIQQIRRAV